MRIPVRLPSTKKPVRGAVAVSQRLPLFKSPLRPPYAHLSWQRALGSAGLKWLEADHRGPLMQRLSESLANLLGEAFGFQVGDSIHQRCL
jgi:hypothetical protein